MPLDLGAQWIGDTHERMFRLAAELGVETFAQYDEGETSYELGGAGVMRENDFHATLRPSSWVSSSGCCADSTSSPPTVPVEAPWLAPRAAEWDVITAAAWYDAQGLSPVARTLLEICTVGILAVPTAEVSFLHLLFTDSNLRRHGRIVRRVRGRRADHPVRRAVPARSRVGWPR